MFNVSYKQQGPTLSIVYNRSLMYVVNNGLRKCERLKPKKAKKRLRMNRIQKWLGLSNIKLLYGEMLNGYNKRLKNKNVRSVECSVCFVVAMPETAKNGSSGAPQRSTGPFHRRGVLFFYFM